MLLLRQLVLVQSKILSVKGLFFHTVNDFELPKKSAKGQNRTLNKVNKRFPWRCNTRILKQRKPFECFGVLWETKATLKRRLLRCKKGLPHQNSPSMIREKSAFVFLIPNEWRQILTQKFLKIDYRNLLLAFFSCVFVLVAISTVNLCVGVGYQELMDFFWFFLPSFLNLHEQTM